MAGGFSILSARSGRTCHFQGPAIGDGQDRNIDGKKLPFAANLIISHRRHHFIVQWNIFGPAPGGDGIERGRRLTEAVAVYPEIGQYPFNEVPGLAQGNGFR